MRTLDELINRDEPGIAILRSWTDSAESHPCEIFPPAPELREETLLRLQVTTRSLFGSIAYDTGGVSVANGRLRLLGSGQARSLLRTNEGVGGMRSGASDDFVIVADDILGGVYALNGGRFGADTRGQVFYLAADGLEWTSLDVGHADFVHWCVTGDHAALYKRFETIPDFAAAAPPFDKSISFYPFLWTNGENGQPPSTRIIDADEVVRLHVDVSGFRAG